MESVYLPIMHGLFKLERHDVFGRSAGAKRPLATVPIYLYITSCRHTMATKLKKQQKKKRWEGAGLSFPTELRAEASFSLSFFIVCYTTPNINRSDVCLGD